MSTVVAGVMVRDRTPDMFDDLLTAYPGTSYTAQRANGITALTFNVDLDDETAAAIRDRMTSRDDADMAKRANIRALLAAVDLDPSLENVTALAVAAAAQVLCE